MPRRQQYQHNKNMMRKMDNILTVYKENEDNNLHAENYVLLAKHFGNEEQQKLADENLRFRDRVGYSSPNLSLRCLNEINPFYAKLSKMAKTV